MHAVRVLLRKDRTCFAGKNPGRSQKALTGLETDSYYPCHIRCKESCL